MPNNYALYYPSMEFRDEEWLKGMLLFWDGIKRIVPNSYTPSDNKEVLAFIDEGIIESIDPGKDASSLANEFEGKLEIYKKKASAFNWSENPEEYKKYCKIHPDKVDARLREVLSSKEISIMTKDWLLVSEDFGSFYMFYLANAMAKKRNLAKITDNTVAWTASTFFDYDGAIDGMTDLDSDKQIISLMLKEFIPNNINNLSSRDIISFREEYKYERKKFIESVKIFSNNISKIDDSKRLKEEIEGYKKEVEDAVSEYQKSLRSLKFTSLVGIKTITIPISINYAASFLGFSDYKYQILSSTAGLAIGLIASYSEYKQKRKKLIKESDYSYIYFLNSSFDDWSYNGGSLNYDLYRHLEEFIND